MSSLFQIDIPKRSANCSHRGERFVPGMEVYSLISEEAQRFIRRDFCSACWNQFQENEQQINRRYWKSKMEAQTSVVVTSRSLQALTLLRQMLQTNDSHENEVFVLCLFLAHARQLALRQEFQEEGNFYHLYEILKQEEFITVKAPQLTSIQIDTIQKSIAAKFQSMSLEK